MLNKNTLKIASPIQEERIKDIMSKIEEIDLGIDISKVLEDLHSREKIITPTYFGTILVHHIKSEALSGPTLIIGVADKPILTEDNEKLELELFVGWPTNTPENLEFLGSAIELIQRSVDEEVPLEIIIQKLMVI